MTWWLLAILVTPTAAYINPKCKDLGSIRQFFDKCKYTDGGRVMNCTDLPILRLNEDLVKANVEMVYVDKCCMTFIPERTFQAARHLRHLDASHNLLSTLHQRVFTATTRLSHLDVSVNLIHSLYYRTFTGLYQLSYLNLGDNKLQALDSRLFRDTKKLSHLDLSNNKLDNLHYTIFNSTFELVHLNLSKNRLEMLNSRLLKNTFKLSRLDLSSNNLETLEERLFDSLKVLEYLDLSWNKLYSLEDTDLFASLGKLNKLSLANNNISDINVKVFAPLEALQILDLSENPFLRDNMTFCYLREGLEIIANSKFWNVTVCPEKYLSKRFTTEITVGVNVALITAGVIVFVWMIVRRVKSKKPINFVYDDVGNNFYETVGNPNPAYITTADSESVYSSAYVEPRTV